MTTETGERTRRKAARRAVRDYRNCVRQLEAIRLELGPAAGRGWVTRGYAGQFEEFYEPEAHERPLSLALEFKSLPGLRISQRIIRRYDRLLKRAHTLSLKALASTERLQRVMHPRETVRDVLRGRRADTH